MNGLGVVSIIGSSPLARGTRPPVRPRPPRVRFNPARAGNTRRRTPRTPPPAVHPRSRGEHLVTIQTSPRLSGSSPLARGTLQIRPTDGQLGRFIPARAGNTRLKLHPLTHRPVHPRSRGEHAVQLGTMQPKHGSSPLARGTRISTSPPHCSPRFIPARAGNTAFRRRRRRCRAAHPRSRGEHSGGDRSQARSLGSSPLARGTPASGRDVAGDHRLIPARAGNTNRLGRRGSRRSAHPRSRGEHSSRKLPNR